MSDPVPYEEYEPVPGDCLVCGGGLLWGGMGWTAHTHEYHERRRAALYGALARLMDREADARVRGAQAGVYGHVALRWRSGALRGPGNQWWTDVPAELMQAWDRDEELRAGGLRALRVTLADYVEATCGVRVNPATFGHRVYDGR